jgi:hypothetical protein
MGMIGVELIRELVETVILTGRVKGVDPVSLLLVANPESGKTSVVLAKDCKSVEAFTDVTGRGIHMILAQKKDITHIVINDLVAVLSHKQSVNRYTISQLNALTEEGISKLATPAGIQEYEGGRKGIIASLTTDMASDARHWWNKVGFASRMLPFCYYYPDELIIQIKNEIDAQVTNLPALEPGRWARKAKDARFADAFKKEFITPSAPVSIIYPKEISDTIRYIADVRSHILEEQGMRRLKQYHAIIQGHALLMHLQDKKNILKVEEKDLDFIKRIDLFVSYTKAQPL